MTSIELRRDGLFDEEDRRGPTRLDEVEATRFEELHGRLEEDRRSGRLPPLPPLDRDEVADSIRAFAEGAGQAFQNVVVLGVGDSAPGTRALLSSLLPPWWNELDAEERDYYPRLYVVDSTDPDTVGPFLRHVSPAHSLYNVISRSGENPETIALFLTVKRALEAALGEGIRRHLIFTTGVGGPLGRFAAEEEIVALPYPHDLPGRFSILSAAGLLPAALVGIDIEELLAGAREIRERCHAAELRENPAGRLALALYHAHARLGARVQLLVPCTDRLADFGPWFRQLWSEMYVDRSSAAEVSDGPMPLAAPDGSRRYSRLQRLGEDSGQGVVILLTVRESLEDLEVPLSEQAVPGLDIPRGQHLGELFRRQATEAQTALRRAGRPSLTLELSRLTPRAVGELVMLLQLAALYGAALYGVDPLADAGEGAYR